MSTIIMRAGRRLNKREQAARWQTNAIVGASMVITQKTKGTIDDLATCLHTLPIRKNERTMPLPSHQPYYLGFYHINYNNHNQPMDLLTQKSSEISPPYLLQLSKQVDVLSKLSMLDRQGPLTQEFSQVLHDQFSELSQYLALYPQDSVMKQCSLLKCKIALSYFVWQKALGVIPKQLMQIKSAFSYLFQRFFSFNTALESLIHQERSSKSAIIDGEKDKIIAGLRRELTVKREHMHDLEQRVKEIQDQNSKLYSKLITNAMQKVDYFSKTSTNQYRSTSTDKGSPRKKNTARSIRSLQDQILEIIQSKRKHQSINQRRSSLSQYLSTYFTMKYGKPLAQQNEADFRQTVCYLAKTQQKHIFVLYQAILEEECDQAYFLQQRIFLQKVTKCIKRYINQKYGRTMQELERFFDARNEEKTDFALTQDDVEAILSNIYKHREIHTLQRIICELLTSQDPKQSDRVSCRKFLNQLLGFQLEIHMTRIDDIVRQIQRSPQKGNLITFDQFQRIVLKTISDHDRRNLILKQLQRQRCWTSSQVIEIIQRVRRSRSRRE